MIGALIGAGVSLIGGLFGRSDAKKQQKRADQAQAQADAANRAAAAVADAENRRLAAQLSATPLVQTNSSMVDVDAMMNAAERSGYNPVTWLLGGGMGAYTQTGSVTTGHNAAAAAQLASPSVYQQAASPTVPIPSIGSVFSNALSTGFGIWSDGQAKLKEQTFQRELLDAQLKGVNSNPRTGSFSRSFSVPSTVTSGGTTKTNGVTGAPLVPTSGEVTVTNPFLTWHVDPTVPDAVAWEDNMGEIGGLLGGASNVFDNILYNVTGLTHKERGDMTRSAIGGLAIPGIDQDNYPAWVRPNTGGQAFTGTGGGGGW